MKTKRYAWFIISTKSCNWLVPECVTLSFLCVSFPLFSCVFLISASELVIEDILTESRLIPKAISKCMLIALGGESGHWVEHYKRLCRVDYCTLGQDYVQGLRQNKVLPFMPELMRAQTAHILASDLPGESQATSRQTHI